VIARISARGGKIHTNEQSVNLRQRNDTTIFGEKLSIVVLGNGKQTLLSARQKLTATGSRVHIKANSRDGQGERKDWDTTRADRRRSTTRPHRRRNRSTCLFASTLHRDYHHVVTFGFVSHALFCEVKLCIEANESYVQRRGWNT
jgi:hypothetical protein